MAVLVVGVVAADLRPARSGKSETGESDKLSAAKVSANKCSRCLRRSA